MSDDILDRLRRCWGKKQDVLEMMADDAADEIVLLRNALHRIQTVQRKTSLTQSEKVKEMAKIAKEELARSRGLAR